jgi:tetratricopeptide (TPR) repeat protein
MTSAYPARLADHLDLLEWFDFVRLAQTRPEVEYIFRHPLAQEVAYETLLRVDRQRLHRAVGEALEALYPDWPDRFATLGPWAKGLGVGPELTRLHPEQSGNSAPSNRGQSRLAGRDLAARLSHHFHEAGDDARTLKYSSLAGAAALANYANAEAEAHYRLALSLAQTPAECAHLLAQLGEALFNQSRFADAIQAWREAIAQCRVTGDADSMARMYARAARAAGGGGLAGDTLRALELCWDGLDAMAGLPESRGLAALLHETGRTCYFSGLHDDAREFTQRAVDMAERLGDVATQADAMATLWGAMLFPAEQCVVELHRAIELARSVDRLDIVSRAYHNLGNSLGFMLGDLPRGIAHVLEAVEVDERRGHFAEEFFSLRVASGMAWMAGDLAQVEAIVERQRGLLHHIPDPQRERGHLQFMQVARPWLRGDLAEARRRFDEAHFDQLHFGDRIAAADLLIELGEVKAADALLRQGLRSDSDMVGVTMRTQLSVVRARQARLDDARRLLQEARQIPSEFGLMDEMYLAYTEAQLALAEARWEDALAAFGQATSIQAKGGMRWYEARTLREWAQAHLARGAAGDRDRALELLRASLAHFEAIGATGYAAAVREEIGD